MSANNLLEEIKDSKERLVAYLNSHPNSYRLVDGDIPKVEIYLDKNENLDPSERLKIVAEVESMETTAEEIVEDWDSYIVLNEGLGFVDKKVMESARKGNGESVSEAIVIRAMEFESNIMDRERIFKKHPAMNWNELKEEIAKGGHKIEYVERKKDTFIAMSKIALLMSTAKGSQNPVLSSAKHVANNIDTVGFQAKLIQENSFFEEDIREINRERLIESVYSNEM